jgi:hypothetical protein
MSTPRTRKPDPWRKGQWRPADDRRSDMQQVIDRLDLIADRLKAVAEVLPPPPTVPLPPPPPPERKPNAAGVVPTNLTAEQLAATQPSAETVRRIKLAAEQFEQREIERQESEYKRGRAFPQQWYDPALARMTYRPRPKPETLDAKLNRERREKAEAAGETFMPHRGKDGWL